MCVVDVSGSTITPGTPATFQSSGGLFQYGLDVCAISSTHAVIAYKEGNMTTLRAVSISGTTMTLGTAVATGVSAMDVNDISIVDIDSTTIITSYADNTADKKRGAFYIADISGTTITARDITNFHGTQISHQGICALSATEFAVCFKDTLNQLPTAPYSEEANRGSTTLINTLSTSLYLTSQYVTTISTTDTVDTTFYSDLNSVTATETLNSQTADYAFSFNPTQTANVVTGGTFVIIGAGETTVRNIVSSLNSVHGGTAGNWYKNTNATYGSETWAAATTNEAKAAVQEAMATAQNRMTGTAVGAVSDANWPSFGTLFAVAITLQSTSTTATPTVDGISFNYDADVINRLETDAYTVEMPAVGTIKVTAPSSGGPRNARIYVSG
jgi:hypothetical protein